MHNTEDRDLESILSELFYEKTLVATLLDRTISKAKDNHFLAQLTDQELSVLLWAVLPLQSIKQTSKVQKHLANLLCPESDKVITCDYNKHILNFSAQILKTL
jgi:hypothetical protein